MTAKRRPDLTLLSSLLRTFPWIPYIIFTIRIAWHSWHSFIYNKCTFIQFFYFKKLIISNQYIQCMYIYIIIMYMVIAGRTDKSFVIHALTPKLRSHLTVARSLAD
jgi:hypothetical protein